MLRLAAPHRPPTGCHVAFVCSWSGASHRVLESRFNGRSACRHGPVSTQNLCFESIQNSKKLFLRNTLLHGPVEPGFRYFTVHTPCFNQRQSVLGAPHIVAHRCILWFLILFFGLFFEHGRDFFRFSQIEPIWTRQGPLTLWYKILSGPNFG